MQLRIQVSSVCCGHVALHEQRAALGIEARRRAAASPCGGSPRRSSAASYGSVRRGGRRRSRGSGRAPPTGPGRPPSAGPRRGSCRDGSRRWAGCPRTRAAWRREVTSVVGRPTRLPVRLPDSSGCRGGPVAGTLDPMSYEVRTPVFEGPFDLLLHLILKQEVELWEVSLSRDRRRLPRRARPHGRASTSTSPPSSCSSPRRWWSSRPAACCPGSTTLELDEELLRFEERDLLLARLLECKTFKDAAKALEARMRRADRSVPRTAGPEEPFRSLAPDPLERVTPDAAPRRRAAGARGAARGRSSTPTTSPRSAPACATRSRPCCGCCPSGADELPGPRRRARRTGSRSSCASSPCSSCTSRASSTSRSSPTSAS